MPNDSIIAVPRDIGRTNNHWIWGLFLKIDAEDLNCSALSKFCW